MIANLDTIEYKLGKRGFKQADGLLHPCPACKAQGVRRYAILGRAGGRDIAICQECGDTQSWRSGQGMEERVLDPNFDLTAFLA
jgi:hypothetical protein